MLLKEFKTTHPTLFSMLKMMGEDSSLEFQKEILNDQDLVAMENQANMLNSDERVTMAVGERGDQETLIERYNLQLLDGFLDSCFDGALSVKVWR